MANEESSKNLAQTKTGTLSSRTSRLSIGELERNLLKRFPASDAEEWDHTGLLVGDPLVPVGKVALALDPTVEAIDEARAFGANVLITHHPAYLTPPSSFSPSGSVPQSPGSAVWAAIENRIALMCFHTALDVSPEAARVLPGMLRLNFQGILDPIDDVGEKGYGQICVLSPEESSLSLGQLAARCTSVFGRHPRVWGEFDRGVTKVVTCTGSSSDLAAKSLSLGADVLICGEIRYHDALSAAQAGLAIIDLGHDTSELPLVAVLSAAVESIGLTKDKIAIIDQSSNWNSPESVRV